MQTIPLFLFLKTEWQEKFTRLHFIIIQKKENVLFLFEGNSLCDLIWQHDLGILFLTGNIKIIFMFKTHFLKLRVLFSCGDNCEDKKRYKGVKIIILDTSRCWPMSKATSEIACCLMASLLFSFSTWRLHKDIIVGKKGCCAIYGRGCRSLFQLILPLYVATIANTNWLDVVRGACCLRSEDIAQTRSNISCATRALDAAAQGAGNPVAQKTHSSNLRVWTHATGPGCDCTHLTI